MALMKKHGLLESKRVLYLKIDDVKPNRFQPRTIFDTEGLRELAESIHMYGVLQPLTVRKHPEGGYELVAGERRLRASRLSGLTEVPCVMLEADDKQSSLIALVENLQRCDLDFFEEAEGIRRLIRQFGLSQDEAARRLGKSQSAVANKLRILRHSSSVINEIRSNGLTERHARALLKIEGEKEKLDIISHITENRLNVAQTEEYIDSLDREIPKAEHNKTKKQKTMFVLKDVRMFMNSISKAVDTMRRSGLEAKMEKIEEEQEIHLSISIPKIPQRAK